MTADRLARPTALALPWAILAVACGLAACDGVQAPAHEQANAADSTAARADPSQAAGSERQSAEIARLRAEVAMLRAATASASSPETPRRPRDDPQAQAEAARIDQQRVSEAEAAFQREPFNGAWSQKASSDVQAALAASGSTGVSLASAVRSVDCRSRTCRVVIDAQGGPAVQGELPLVLLRLASTLPRATGGPSTDAGDGRAATVLYLSR